MYVKITLTTPGADTGPFDLYSDSDGYVTPFATSISKASLVAGYISLVVPDDADFVRVLSTGTCTNYVDLEIDKIPTPPAPEVTKIQVTDGYTSAEPVICYGTMPPTEGTSTYHTTIVTLLDQYDNPIVPTSPINVVLGYHAYPCYGGPGFDFTVGVTITTSSSSASHTYTYSSLVDCGQSNCVIETNEYTGPISNSASLPFV
jgi:hypothetical protein